MSASRYYAQGSLALRGKESKQTLVKKNSVVEAIKKTQEKEVKKTQKEISPSSSSSSEEGLMCVFSDNETSSEEKVRAGIFQFFK